MSSASSSAFFLGLHPKTRSNKHAGIPSTISSSLSTANIPFSHRPHPTDDSKNPSVQAKTPQHGATRREAIAGIGALVGLFSSLSALPIGSPPPAWAAEEAVQCELTAAPSGLAFCDRVVGTGNAATKGQLIKAHYVGKLENGKVFDSSYSRGRPLTFRVGVGEVIKGWDQGILGGGGVPPMLAGGKRTLKLPPELGYGMRGAGCKGGSCVIPPDSTLLFDVEFVGAL